MSDTDSIELAGTWKQDFINKASRTQEVTEKLPSGILTTHIKSDKTFDPHKVPVLLLGNKYDIVSTVFSILYYLGYTYACPGPIFSFTLKGE